MYYNSFLTYHRLREYIVPLIENELIEYIDYKDMKAYKTTDKAIHLLSAYYVLRELIG
ncbi:MAG: winged helix-turn-helix domain-containing protein [Nitrososphaeraceae archaeon]